MAERTDPGPAISFTSRSSPEVRRDRNAWSVQIVAAFGPPVVLDESVAVGAARLRASHRSLRLPDAIVLATAEVLDAQAVVTGDKRWERVDPPVRLVRPTTA